MMHQKMHILMKLTINTLFFAILEAVNCLGGFSAFQSFLSGFTVSFSVFPPSSRSSLPWMKGLGKAYVQVEREGLWKVLSWIMWIQLRINQVKISHFKNNKYENEVITLTAAALQSPLIAKVTNPRLLFFPSLGLRTKHLQSISWSDQYEIWNMKYET